MQSSHGGHETLTGCAPVLGCLNRGRIVAFKHGNERCQWSSCFHHADRLCVHQIVDGLEVSIRLPDLKHRPIEFHIGIHLIK